MIRYLIKLVLLCAFFFPYEVYAKSGCCSWHDGVDYCDTTANQIVCNDGSYSPSCTCDSNSFGSNSNKSNSDDNSDNTNDNGGNN